MRVHTGGGVSRVIDNNIELIHIHINLNVIHTSDSNKYKTPTC